jgi:hypothetical protein
MVGSSERHVLLVAPQPEREPLRERASYSNTPATLSSYIRAVQTVTGEPRNRPLCDHAQPVV